MKLAALLGVILQFVLSLPTDPSGPTVTINGSQSTYVGLTYDVIDEFRGIPFAQPPVEDLRLKPPKPLDPFPSSIQIATENGAACPQFFFSRGGGFEFDHGIKSEVTETIAKIRDTQVLQTADLESEDCLHLNIQRPRGIDSNAKLPVLVWIYGGGFQIGWNHMYDGLPLIQESIRQDKPIIFVTVNYRVGGFGFLPIPEADLRDGDASNLGLLDQRLALKWVSDNIEEFGGDPSKVTIWGESAGAISVFDQMAIDDGDNIYNDKQLFRAGIMNSGSIAPAESTDSEKAQTVYNTVVKKAGCSGESEKLTCLRNTTYETFLEAVKSVPSMVSYSSVALSYLPRPDKKILKDSPDVLASEGRYAKIPFIVGNQEDEGTIFALFQSDITREDQLVKYIKNNFFQNASEDQVQRLVDLYKDVDKNGSPFRTEDKNNWYGQYKRLAAIIGDITFTLSRRSFLEMTSRINNTVPSWSYLSSYYHDMPYLGTFHASDIANLFFNIPPDNIRLNQFSYYLNFVNNLNPNDDKNNPNADKILADIKAGVRERARGLYDWITGYNLKDGLIPWPQWSENHDLLNFDKPNKIIRDDFRTEQMDFIRKNMKDFKIKH